MKKVLSFVILIFSIGINVNSVFATNLISNNYFESDYADFWSDYTQAVGDHGLVPEKTFAVDSSASDYRPDTHFDAASPHEGTNFFMANGSNVTTDTVWQTNSLISVAEAGTTYRFEAYICSLVNVGGDPYMAAPDLAFELGDGTTFLPFTTIEKGESTTAGEWYLVYADGKFDTPGNYYLRLMNAQSAPVGNDFGLDSVYFGFAEDAPTVGEYPVDVVDEPDTSTMAVVPNIVTKDPSYTVSQLLNNEVGSTFEGGVLKEDTGGRTLSNVFTVLAINGSIDTNGYDLAVSGDITGSGGLAKIGDGTLTLSGIISNTNGISTSAGTLILSGANTYTGNTTVNGGTLKLGAAGVIADVSALIVNGTFDMNSYSEAVGSLAGSGTVTSSAAGLMTLTAGEDNTSTTFSGIIEDGSGTVSLAKAGAGTLTLSGSNTYTGTTAVNAGTLQVGKSNAITTTTALTMADVASAILDLNDFNQTIGSLAGGGTTGGNVALGSGTLAVGDATSTAYAGIISETGSLVKDGAGTFTLSGSNTYTGGTLISAGTLQMGNGNAAGDGSLGSGDIVNNATLAFNNYNNSVVSNEISGSGNLVQIMSGGVITLAGDNTYTGTTAVNNGMYVGDGDAGGDGTHGTFGTGDVDITGTLHVARSGTFTLANNLVGSGSLYFNYGASGTTILTGTNTYSNQTYIRPGFTLQVGAGGTSGTLGSGTVGVHGALVFDRSDTVTVSNYIYCGGSLTQNGTGTVKLTGGSDYTGVTSVNSGTLNIQNNTATGSTAGGVVVSDGAELQMEHATGIAVGAEALTLNGTGVGVGGALRNIGGDNSWAGAITLGSATRINSDADTLTLGAGGITGAGQVLTVGGAGDTTISGVIGTGAGALIKDGAGTFTLSGSNTYTGTTSIDNGVISCNTVATSGSAQSLGQGATVNLGVAATSSGTLKYTGSTGTLDKAINALGNGSDTIQNSGAGVLTLSGIITKDGTILTLKDGEFLVSGKITGASADSDLIVDGSTVTLTNANNDYNGPTIIQNSGKVIIADDYLGAVPGSATAGNLEFNSGTLNASDTFTLDSNRGIKLTGAGTIDVDTDKTLTYGGIMADSGAFTKAGAGTLTLSATNTYTGGTTVSAGTLYANNNNALGSGDVTSNAILNVGLNTVDIGSGVYTQSNGSTLQLTANSDTEYGSIKSTGDAVATVASTVNVVAGGYINNKAKLTVLDTGSGSSIAPANITTTVTGSSRISFDPSVVGGKLILTADRSSNGFESCGKDENSKAVGNVLDNMTDYTTDMKSILDTLETMSDSDAGDALNTMESPVNRGIIETGRLSIGQSISSILNHFSLLKKNIFGISTGDDVSSDSKFAKPAEAVWAKAFGTYAKQDNRKGIEGYHADIMGGAFGLDFISTNKTTFGLGCGYLYNKIDPEKVSLSRTTADSIQGLLYYGYNHELNYMEKDALYLNLIGSFAYNMYDSKRNINIGTTINRQAKADYDGQQYTAYGEVGYYIPRSKINLIPLASLEYSRLEVDSYTENGADSINLYVNRQHYDLLELGLGLKFSSIIKKENIDIIPEIRGKWLHDFIADKAEVTSRFTGGGASFKTVGAEPAKSVFDVGATLTLLGKNNIKLDLDYDFYIRDDFYSHNGAATLKYIF